MLRWTINFQKGGFLNIFKNKQFLTSFPHNQFSSFSSVAQSCPTLCDPMNSSTPGLPVHHQLPEFTQTHVHRVSDAIQPSHPLLSPSPPAPNPSQHQSLFQNLAKCRLKDSLDQRVQFYAFVLAHRTWHTMVQVKSLMNTSYLIFVLYYLVLCTSEVQDRDRLSLHLKVSPWP